MTTGLRSRSSPYVYVTVYFVGILSEIFVIPWGFHRLLDQGHRVKLLEVVDEFRR